jgi:hypothetical protein
MNTEQPVNLKFLILNVMYSEAYITWRAPVPVRIQEL